MADNIRPLSPAGADGPSGRDEGDKPDETGKPGKWRLKSVPGPAPERKLPVPKPAAVPATARPVPVPAKTKPAGVPAAPKSPPPQASGPPVLPVASPARMRNRHWGLIASFVALVLAPLAALAFYLWSIAEDQYSSVTGFTVRSEEGAAAAEMLGGLAQFTGNPTATDGDILYEYIQSQDLVRQVNEQIDLRAHYAQHWPDDFLFSIWPDASLEDLLWYWQRMVTISYDQSSGLIEVRVLAFDRETAQTIAGEIVRLSQDLVNDLNIQAREDAIGYARDNLDQAEARLKSIREDLMEFRSRTRIVDPEADIEGRMGVMSNLQQQLAEALIEYDLLRDTVSPSDPRVEKAQRRIDVIRERIAVERQTFTSANTDTGAIGEDYPTLLAEYESLVVDGEFAAEAYQLAQAALDLARDTAARQSRYLATYIRPTLAEDAEYPRRFVLLAMAALFLLMAWSIMTLIYYSIRDRG
ncbi:MAG: sugar transporter [Ruegeria sp.]